MKCMKCSRETEPNEVFCSACLKSMAAAPVKPGTPVTIPKRPNPKNAPPAVKKEKPEEVIERLQKSIRKLRITTALLLAALCLSIGIIVLFWDSDTVENAGFGIGQNYSTEAHGEGQTPGPNP